MKVIIVLSILSNVFLILAIYMMANKIDDLDKEKKGNERNGRK